MGVNTCSLCHSGGSVATNQVVPWSKTLHASVFTRGINGQLTNAFTADSQPYHTVGYDATAEAANGGFDDVATSLSWAFPTTLATNNWDNVPAPLKALAN